MGSDGCCTHWVFWMGFVLYPLGIDTSTSGGDTRLAMLHTLGTTHIHAATTYLLPVESISDKLLHQKTVQVNINITLCLSATSSLIGSLHSAGLDLI